MKKLLLFAAAATMFAACSKDTTEDINVLPENIPPHDVLQISVGDEDESRIQLDNGKTVWTQGDKVSVFYKTTGNECYQFIGNTGDTRGSIMKVSGSAGATAIDKNIVIYPYNKDYELDLMNNTVSVVIPSTQRYAKNSYGVGANVMIASSSNNSFTLRNICGWLKLQFTGNAIINAIKIKGNNNEQLAGTAIANYEDFSTFLYGNLANSGDDIGGIILPPGEYAREITLDCGTGLMLSDVPTEFYIAVAPQTLSKGISITAECYGNLSKINKSTGKSITIARNHIVPVANIDIDTSVIFYTSLDGRIVKPNSRYAFDATIVSNTYENGIGMIVFNGNITKIGNNAFKDCYNLKSVNIPDNVTSIGDLAFADCYNLTAFYGKYASADNRCLIQDGKLIAFAPAGLTKYTIPNSVTSIGDYAFYGCSNLTSITISDGVTSIGDFAFFDCYNLKSVNIPDNVTSIGERPFQSCSGLTAFYGKYVSADNRCLIQDGKLIAFAPYGLTEYVIPDSVTSIGEYIFRGCSSLTSITIPDSVTSIGEYAFYDCSSLKSVYITDIAKWCAIQFRSSAYSNPLCYAHNLYLNGELVTNLIIPDGVTSIGAFAFFKYISLKSVNIPDSVTEIRTWAFNYCSSLTSIYCKPITPPSLSFDSYPFSHISSSAKIYVPTASVDAYKSATGWSDYASMIEGYDF